MFNVHGVPKMLQRSPNQTWEGNPNQRVYPRVTDTLIHSKYSSIMGRTSYPTHFKNSI